MAGTFLNLFNNNNNNNMNYGSKPNYYPGMTNFANQSSVGNVGASKDFLESNSLVARLSFMLVIIVLFVVILRLGITLLVWWLGASNSPHLINGSIDSTQMMVFPQDPRSKGAVTIPRSVNAKDGLEFTWSVWIYINNIQYLENQYRHIFHKGNETMNSKGMIYPNNAPGLYIAPNTNSLVVVMNTYSDINEEVVIPDIPLNKWVNVMIRCENNTLDVYINGTISRSIKLAGVPKQNYGNVYVSMNGGFSGNTSNLWYYNYALGTTQIQRIVDQGPNTKMVGSSMNLPSSNYLSLRWYFTGAKDQFNP